MYLAIPILTPYRSARVGDTWPGEMTYAEQVAAAADAIKRETASHLIHFRFNSS
jgi:hypothetical protein